MVDLHQLSNVKDNITRLAGGDATIKSLFALERMDDSRGVPIKTLLRGLCGLSIDVSDSQDGTTLFQRRTRGVDDKTKEEFLW